MAIIMFAFLCLASSALFKDHEEKSFVAWMRNNNRIFTGEEYQLRFGIFLTNLRLIKEHKGNYRIGLSKFAVYTPSEYQILLGSKQLNIKPKYLRTEFKAPESVDWREKGAVTPIKNQGDCGSCWAFSAIGAAESAWKLQGDHELLILSEQNLVDCAFGCMGCGGGDMGSAYQYVIEQQNGKFALESDYPYEAVDKECRFDITKADAHVTEYITIKPFDEVELAEKCAKFGPISVQIDASPSTFGLYSGGIYDDPKCNPMRLNHGVVLVGYGIENDIKYWIVKNSWGENWGEKGYIRFIKDQGNQCGISTNAIFPLI